MLKKIFDSNDKKMIDWAVNAIAIAHELTEGKERLNTLEDCVNDVKKPFRRRI